MVRFRFRFPPDNVGNGECPSDQIANLKEMVHKIAAEGNHPVKWKDWPKGTKEPKGFLAAPKENTND